MADMTDYATLYLTENEDEATTVNYQPGVMRMTSHETLSLTEKEASTLVMCTTADFPVEFVITSEGIKLSRTQGNEWAYDAVVKSRRVKQLLSEWEESEAGLSPIQQSEERSDA